MAAALLIAALAVGGVGWGRVPVTRVVIDAPGAKDPNELLRIFGIKSNDILSRSEVRAGVQALMASGQVEDASVDVEPDEQGVVMTVHAEIAARVGSVKIDGLSRSQARQVRRQLGLVKGTPLRVGEFEENVSRAVAQLRDQGYPSARLDPDLDFDVPAGTVAVHLQATLGPPLEVAELSVEGADLTGQALWRACSLKPGQRLTGGSLARAQRLLGEHFRKDGFWDAEVDAPKVTTGPHGASVSLHVVPGPKYRLDLHGLKMSKALKEDALPFLLGEEPFDSADVDLTLRRVLIYLQRNGRLQAKVTGNVDGEGDERTFHLNVVEGPVVAIKAVRFPGAHAMPVSLLRERVGARPGHPWRWGDEPVDEETLEADATSLLGTLREAGFADAKVGSPQIVPEGNDVVIDFPIEEGEKSVVTALTVTGVPEGVKLPVLPVAEGEPWSEIAEKRAEDAVTSALQEAGYEDATVAASHTCVEQRCKVVLSATAGERSVLGRLVVAGLARTKLSVVREVLGLTEGKVAGPQEQLRAQRRLLSLGLFDRVTVKGIPGQETGPRRGLLVDVVEGESQATSVGLGWNSVEHARISLAWSELNLFGTGRSLSLEVLLSGQENTFQLSYQEPRSLGLLGVPTSAAVYRAEEHYPDYRIFRRGVWAEIGDRLQRPGRILLRYDYEIQRTVAPEAVLSQLERDKQSIAIASFTPTLEWDTRDDFFEPRRGIYASAQLQHAFRAFLADASFEKLSASVAAFQPIGGGVIAASVRAGGVQPSGPCGTPCPPDNLRLPIGVRFFAGGRVTNRAFATDRLGAKGTFDAAGNALGGAGQLLTSVEWRFPIYAVVGGSTFVDGGNVWPRWRDIRVPDFRWGAGVGLRVETPVGPFRLEYGWKLDRKPGESGGELLLSFGNPF